MGSKIKLIADKPKPVGSNLTPIEEGSEVEFDGRKMKVAYVEAGHFPHKVLLHLENTE